MKPYKLLLIISFMLFSVGNTFAQNNDMKARMEFEDAETAYQNQDYSKAVTHLESAEKLLGKPTGKTRYLLILAKANVFLNTEGYEYKDLEKLRGLSKYYLDNYTTDTEKYREIYDLSNVLNNNFPKTEQEYNQLVFKKIQEKQAQQKIELEEKLAELENLKQNQNFLLELAKEYGGYVPNMKLDDFAKISPRHQELVDKYLKSRYSSTSLNKDEGVYEITVNKNEIIKFTYIINKKSKLLNRKFRDELEEIIKNNIDERYYKQDDHDKYDKSSRMWTKINVPNAAFDEVTIWIPYVSGPDYIKIEFITKR